jgi:hypothetical protein
MEGVKTWLSSMAADFFDTGIRYDECLNSGGDYLRRNFSMYLFVAYIIHFVFSFRVFLIAHNLNCHQYLCKISSYCTV